MIQWTKPLKKRLTKKDIEQGKKLITKEDIEQRFSRKGTCGIATTLGHASGGQEILDADEKNQPGIVKKLLAALEEQCPELLDKLVVWIKTPSGGAHVHYKCFGHCDGPDVLAWCSKDGKLNPVIERKGQKCMTPVPPTKGYEYLIGNLEDGVPEIDVGERKQLERICRSLNEFEAKKGGKTPAQGSVTIVEGYRHQTLFSAGCSKRARGAEEDEILSYLINLNKTRCDPELDEKEIFEIVGRVVKYERGEAGDSEKEKQAQILLKIAEQVELWHTPDHRPYATVPIQDHFENLEVGGPAFKRWLAGQYYKETDDAAGTEAFAKTILILQSQALYGEGAQEHEIYVRRAQHEGAIYLDLTNKEWEVVRIDKTGWEVISNPPVKFRRSQGMKPLPHPVSGGSLKLLRPLMNAPTEELWVMHMSWLISVMCPYGPYPVSVSLGENDSAKSTAARLKKMAIDPGKPPLRALPRNGRDLVIAARNCLILSFDNVSSVPDWLSDAFCQIATGAGFAARQLWTDAEEMLFDDSRSIEINGIESMVTRSDLVDRSFINTHSPIEKHLKERKIYAEFKKRHPKILGAILDAVSEALRNINKVKIAELPRMADATEWIVAAEPALPWRKGSFEKFYKKNRAEAIEATLEADLLAEAIRKVMTLRVVLDEIEQQGVWSVTATNLLAQLDEVVDERVMRSKNWPAAGNVLSGKLRRSTRFLRKIGIDIQLPKTTDRPRLITIKPISIVKEEEEES
ncbi:primase C-terminal domain-containing protein [Acidobacteria bacterium AH-259-L09]|nr:primase C-terminal domain-containing protein [Acidobacteria bacterium AH-259-L09]